MGTYRSQTNLTGQTVSGVLLGEPVIQRADGSPPQAGDATADLWFAWDDSALPTTDVVVADPLDDVVVAVLGG